MSHVRFTLTFGLNIGKDRSVARPTARQYILSQVEDVGILFSSLFELEGVYQGEIEQAFRLETIVPREDESDMRQRMHYVAMRYNSQYEQDCVMLTRESIEMSLIERVRQN